MRAKLYDFLSSYGLMFLGLCLLFASSFGLNQKEHSASSLPTASTTAWQISSETGWLLNGFHKTRPVVPLPKNRISQPKEITAVSALIVDDKSGAVLYAKNTEVIRPLASITKLMSALVLLDLNINFSSTTEVRREDQDLYSHHLNLGEKFKLADLWQTALVGSSNSAINILVKNSGVTMENFVVLMNKKAQALKLNSAFFTEPTGLDDGNLADAYDTAILLKEALKEEKIAQVLYQSGFELKPLNVKNSRYVWSTNLLLTKWVPNDFKVGQLAGKTGYITLSDYNFVVKITDNNRAVRVVVLGSKTSEKRFIEARDLANWAFSTYVWPEEPGYEKLAE